MKNINFIPILQYIVTSVFALEQSIPQGGFGSTKKQIILNGVETLVKATAAETGMLAAAGSNVGTNNEINAVSTLAGQFIDSTVQMLNHGGVFTSSNSTQANQPLAAQQQQLGPSPLATQPLTFAPPYSGQSGPLPQPGQIAQPQLR